MKQFLIYKQYVISFSYVIRTKPWPEGRLQVIRYDRVDTSKITTKIVFNFSVKIINFQETYKM